jgi:hypothetical protein
MEISFARMPLQQQEVIQVQSAVMLMLLNGI